MLQLRDAVSILPQISLAAGSVAANTTLALPAKVVVDATSKDAIANFLISLMPQGINIRTLHAVLVASNLFWYQATRQTVAVLSVFMCKEFATMDKSQQAQLIAAPSVGNMVTQAFGGLFLRYLPGGTKTAITIALIGLATGCTMLPLALDFSNSRASPSSTTFPLGLAFSLLSMQGFLFGPMFPAHTVLLSKWLPPNERGSAMAYGEIAMSIASMGVPLFVTSIAEYTAKPAVDAASKIVAGWRNGFYITGLACFGYMLTWNILGRNDPESCSYISKQELALLRSVQEKSAPRKSKGVKDRGSKDSNKNDSLPWQRILLHPSILTLFFVHMVYNFVILSINSWMPTYYNDILGLNPNDAKLHIVLPQLVALVVKLCVSKFAILVREIRNNTTKSKAGGDDPSVILFSRRFMGYLGFAVMSLPLFLLPMVAPPKAAPALSSPWYSTGLFSAALAGTGFHAESFRANYLDVTRTHVGLVSGVGNCLSSLSAVLSPFVVGALIQKNSGDWSSVWRVLAVSALAAGLAFGSFSTTTPVEEHE